MRTQLSSKSPKVNQTAKLRTKNPYQAWMKPKPRRWRSSYRLLSKSAWLLIDQHELLALVSARGKQTPQLNILQPLGSLSYNYHQPVANIAVDLGHNLIGKVAWNYYQYGEKSFIGP